MLLSFTSLPFINPVWSCRLFGPIQRSSASIEDATATMNASTPLGLSVMELSNIVSVIAVILCFCAMILFITSLVSRTTNPNARRNMMVLRMHGDDLVFHSSLHQVPARIPQMNMMKVHIPFTFKLLETSKSTYSEIQCNVSSQVKYCIKVFWGVNIKELHLCLWRPWRSIKDLFLDGSLLIGHYQHLGPEIRKFKHPDEVLKLSLKAALDLGTPPRLCYPLVIFLIRIDQDETVHPDETVALVNVVHIKDNVCTLPTSILAQYLKQANGQLSCLKQLYLATGNPGSYEEDGQIPLTLAEPVDGGPESLAHTEESTMWNVAGEQLCVVCQMLPLSRALLPCRHTCVCACCFTKLERCPLCRGPINTYFCIRGEDYVPSQSPQPSKTVPEHGPIYNWLDSLNDRFIDFLGFQR